MKRIEPGRDQHATRDEITAVSAVAHCDEFVEAFKNQYDTIVGERGVRLSGGQRQRVAIACDKQYRFERDRFINLGEDFTPEPAAAGVPSPAARPNNAL